VASEPRPEPTPSAVWQSGSVAVMHPNWRHRRYHGRSGQALGARQNVKNHQHIKEEVWVMELGMEMLDASLNGTIRTAIWDPRSR